MAEGAPRRVAVLVGQSRFPASNGDLADLAFAHADVDALAALLTEAPGTPYDDVRVIKDGTAHDALVAVERAARSTREDDLFLLHYSGHGKLRDQRLSLAFENTDPEALLATGVRVSQLLDILDGCGARSRLMVLDCCYSGAVGREFERSGITDQIEEEMRGSGTVIMTAANRTQVAKENPAYGHGTFTKHMIDGLAGAADRDGDGTVTAQELFDYVYRMTAAEGRQRPRKFNIDGEGLISVRETGREPWKERTAALRARLFDLSARHLISDGVFDEARALLASPPGTLRSWEKERLALLEAAADGEFLPGPFHTGWAKLAPPEEHDAAEPDPTPEPASRDRRTGHRADGGERPAPRLEGAEDLGPAIATGEGVSSIREDARPADATRGIGEDRGGGATSSVRDRLRDGVAGPPVMASVAWLQLAGYVVICLVVMNVVAETFASAAELGAWAIGLGAAGFVTGRTRWAGGLAAVRSGFYVCGIAMAAIGFLIMATG